MEMSTSLDGRVLKLIKVETPSFYDPKLGIHVVVAEDDGGMNDS